MKLFFVLAMAASAIVLLVQGAPQITSEELGKAVEELQKLFKAEAEKIAQSANHPRESQSAQFPHEAQSAWFPIYKAQSANHPREQGAQKISRIQQYPRVTGQVSGVDIRNCGATGNIINSALSVLNIYFSSNFGVLVDCQISPGCVQVRVDVPANDVIADIDVCDLGNGQACVEVYVEPTQQCIGVIPIRIPIPLTNGQQIFVEVLVDPAIPFFRPNACTTVRVNAPQCP